MNFVFRGSIGDIESGFSGIVPERSSLRIQPVRPVNTNSLAFLVTVLLLFTILNTHQMSPNFLLWLVLGVFLVATSLRMYAACQQLHAQVHSTAGSGLFGHTHLHLQVPTPIALTGRGRLQGLQLQLALLDREFDDLDYETLRALDSDNVPNTHSMTEEEINALPVHKFKTTAPESDQISQLQDASSSSSIAEAKQCSMNAKGSEDDFTCTICLEQVMRGELLRTLPCLHQFHTHCIDPWLRQRGTCPMCKLRVGSEMQDGLDNARDIADMV